MKYRAVLLDFYGTLVEEDQPILTQVTEIIARQTPRKVTADEIGKRWWDVMRSMCQAHFGASFLAQREIEQASLRQLLREYELDLDPIALSAPIFAYWQTPQAQPGAAEFLEQLSVPVCIVSNIDDADLQAAIDTHGWNLPLRVTSQMCRSYKPRPEMFMAALERLDMRPGEVVHIGDSIGSDVIGAQAAGIDVVWLNRRRHRVPTIPPTFQAHDLGEVLRCFSQ